MWNRDAFGCPLGWGNTTECFNGTNVETVAIWVETTVSREEENGDNSIKSSGIGNSRSKNDNGISRSHDEINN